MKKKTENNTTYNGTVKTNDNTSALAPLNPPRHSFLINRHKLPCGCFNKSKDKGKFYIS